MVSTARLPLIEELNTSFSPLALMKAFRNEPFCFFLDSAMDSQKLGRYSFMGDNPFLIFSSSGDTITLNQNGKTTVIKGNPFDILGQLLESYRLRTKNAPVPTHGKSSLIHHDGRTVYQGLPNTFEGGRYHSLGVEMPKIISAGNHCHGFR